MDNNVFGTIEAPDVVEQSYGILGAGAGFTGLISNLVVLITVIGGVWALFNILIAAFTVITSPGESKSLADMSDKITRTFIGLLVMIAAPLIAALIGLFFFGDATAILQPTIVGAP